VSRREGLSEGKLEPFSQLRAGCPALPGFPENHFAPWVSLTSLEDPLDWVRLFGNARPVVLDLGAGEGSFALAYALHHPEKNVLAVERRLTRVRKAVRRAQRMGAANLKVLRLEIPYVLGNLLAPASVREIHLLFPDPWPKRRHAKRRLVSREFAQKVIQALEPGGFFRFLTDQEFYFREAQEIFSSLREMEAQEEPFGCFPPSKFETIFLSQGLPIFRGIWHKKEDFEKDFSDRKDDSS
jgi:tRNA (guanine-N7-)-methyltransferase